MRIIYQISETEARQLAEHLAVAEAGKQIRHGDDMIIEITEG